MTHPPRHSADADPPDDRCGWGYIGEQAWERPGGDKGCDLVACFDMHPHGIDQHLRVCAICLPGTLGGVALALGNDTAVVQTLPVALRP